MYRKNHLDNRPAALPVGRLRHRDAYINAGAGSAHRCRCAHATTAPEPTVVPAPTAAGTRTLTVMTHDSFSVSEAVVAKFQEGSATARCSF